MLLRCLLHVCSVLHDECSKRTPRNMQRMQKCRNLLSTSVFSFFFFWFFSCFYFLYCIRCAYTRIMSMCAPRTRSHSFFVFVDDDRYHQFVQHQSRSTVYAFWIFLFFFSLFLSIAKCSFLIAILSHNHFLHIHQNFSYIELFSSHIPTNDAIANLLFINNFFFVLSVFCRGK